EVLVEDPPHRTWASIRALLEQARGDASVPDRTIDLALAVFGRLADAEGATHGVPADEVHFHEVGALDSLADVIGACEAWRQLGIGAATGSVIAVGSGRIRAAHGDIPVPVPAVARLALGWPTVAGEILPARGHGHSHAHSHGHDHPHDHDHELPAHAQGGPHEHGGRRVPAGGAPGTRELAPPTGLALLRRLAAASGPPPLLTTQALGAGAGPRAHPGRPNVVRVLVGRPPAAEQPPAAVAGDSLPADAHGTPAAALQLEANVADLDPRLWPRVVEQLLEAGALDAWLVPISMKHGRPAVTVHALVREGSEEATAALLMDRTGTLGVRRHRVERVIRTREFTEVEVRGHRVAVKIA